MGLIFIASVHSDVTLKATYTPATIALQNGVAVSGLSDTAGGEKSYRIDVPAGQSVLEILTSGGTGGLCEDAG
jgi:hypothetical protein